MKDEIAANRADHREGARPSQKERETEGEMPPELRRLRPPAPPPALRRRALLAAEAELRATEDHSVAVSAAAALRRMVEWAFRSRVFWLAWSAALLVLLLLPPAGPDRRTPPGPTETVALAAALRPLHPKTGPTVEDLRRRRDPFTSEGIFHHEL